ncbi:MAG TPA: hypothetical protein VEJ63_01900 [Planctomycetota bacterium]|nr:hypothetical protein [Planctomycetota bacterium]
MSSRWLLPVFLSVLSPVAFCEETPSTVPDSPAKAGEREKFEVGEWTAESFANKASAREVVLPGHNGNKLLCVHFEGGDKGKAAVKRLTGLSASADGKVELAVYSGEMQPPKMALALSTGDKFVWQETEAKALKSGWNTLSFDLGGKKWKSEASGWKHEASLDQRTDVRAVVLLVYNGPADGVLYVDALKVDRDDQSSGVEALIKRLGADEFADREAAEKELAEKHCALETLREVSATSKDPEVLARVRRVINRLTGADRQTAAKPPATDRRQRIEVGGMEVQIEVKD